MKKYFNRFLCIFSFFIFLFSFLSEKVYAAVSNCCAEYIVYLNNKLAEIEVGNDVEINDYFVFQVEGSETPKVKKIIRVQKTIKHVSVVITVGSDSILVNSNKLQYDSESSQLLFYLNDELVTSIDLNKINLKFFIVLMIQYFTHLKIRKVVIK